MSEMIIHGDIEGLIIDILRYQTPELLPYSANYSTDLRGYEEPLRWVMVTVEGGSTALYQIIWKPRIDFEVRAERRDVAQRIAQICFGTMFRAAPSRGRGVCISEVKTELGPINVPDKEDVASYRYVFSLRLTCLVDPDTQESP